VSDLPLLQITPVGAGDRPVVALTRERYAELASRVKLLSWLSLGWMTIEGAVAIGAGIVASSIALVGFGLDSVIEGVASVIIVWRFTGNRVFSHAAEQRAQKLVADQLGSAATAGEGRQNMLCAYLAAALLVGLLGNALVGAWWLDPAVGLLIAAVAVKEGAEAWRGEGCCVSSPLDGVGFTDDACEDDCCR
jgi:divalent metal cation (Fe/Co/Zn/Cd) transporter